MSLLVAMLCFLGIVSIIAFIGGLFVGLHELIGGLINIGGIITFFAVIFYYMLSNPNVEHTTTNLENLIVMGITFLVVIVGAVSWLFGVFVGDKIKEMWCYYSR